jgi:hypothetical protein
VFYSAEKEKGERKMNKFSKVTSYALIATLLLGVLFVAAPLSVKAVTNPTIYIINPLTGTNAFTFTNPPTNLGDTFDINVTIANPSNLEISGWQVSISWDSSLLTYTNFVLPSDNIFAYDSPVFASSVISGNIVAGANLGPSATHNWTGVAGTLGVLTLQIIQGVGITPPTSVSCGLNFTALGADTYILSGLGSLPFSAVDGTYSYYWVAPPTIPRFYMVPSSIAPAHPGDPFDVSIYVADVYSGWEITAFQFSIMWNTTLITPDTSNYFSDGTFLETFMYAPFGVLYATDFNEDGAARIWPYHVLPAGYNYSVVGEIMLPDFALPWDGTYHTPYPNTVGGPAPGPVIGFLGTFHFKATDYVTIAPYQYMSEIDFIREDMLVLNHFITEIGQTTLTNATYKVPQKVLGLSIDLYTQYPYPYGGQGGNMSSDSFGPQQEVDLCAYVTYNEYPVQQKLVGFDIFHQPLGPYGYMEFLREATTDSNGVACIAFRLPWPCNDPVGQIFGWWYVNATVEVAEQVVVDNLKFWVWWPVQIISVEPKFSNIPQGKPTVNIMDFEMIYLTYHQQPQPLLTFGTVYDELGFYVNPAYRYLPNIWSLSPPDVQPLLYPSTVFPATDEVSTNTCDNQVMLDLVTPLITQVYYNGTTFYPAIWTWNFTIPLTTNAVVGKAKIFGDAFNYWPWYLGTPYCPEVTNTQDFYITKP